ncbi:UNVERIFIED_CONTAM: hypothetical protein Slati_2672200 [Sesamum latifolium]|uniref:Uncharacterized protein n=1 Tax=Sesamum latifolium TaxID=2727402 RepID=A0AAW2VWM5_9LAMI
MSSTDESVRFVGEVPGDDPSEAMSKRLGPDPSSYTSGQRWSLRQAARRLLDESSKEEKDEVEGSSSSNGALGNEADRVSGRARETHPAGID